MVKRCLLLPAILPKTENKTAGLSSQLFRISWDSKMLHRFGRLPANPLYAVQNDDIQKTVMLTKRTAF
jgi:hypothetical protein